MQRRPRDATITTLGLLGIALIACIALTVGMSQPRRPQGQDRSVDSELGRAGRILAIRLPSSNEKISITDTKVAVRYELKPPYNGSNTEFKLPQEVWQPANALRQQWCENLPQFRALQSQELFYDVGIQCGLFQTHTVRIPTDVLPTALQNLIDHVPPPAEKHDTPTSSSSFQPQRTAHASVYRGERFVVPNGVTQSALMFI